MPLAFSVSGKVQGLRLNGEKPALRRNMMVPPWPLHNDLVPRTEPCTLMTQVLESSGTWRAAAHLAAGLWLLSNILFHYHRCVCTSPGVTTDISAEVRL